MFKTLTNPILSNISIDENPLILLFYCLKQKTEKGQFAEDNWNKTRKTSTLMEFLASKSQ